MKKVAVIMGSDSDFPVVSAAVKRLKGWDIPVEVHVMSAPPHPGAGGSFFRRRERERLRRDYRSSR